MTVAELIEHLKQWPADRRVVIPGYESGFSDLAAPSAVKLEINAYDPSEWFFGAHGETDGDGEESVLLTAASRS